MVKCRSRFFSKQLLKHNLPFVLLVLLVLSRVSGFCEGDIKACAERPLEFNNLLIIQKIDPFLERIRNKAIQRARKYFPSPASELLLGMTIGVDHFKKLPQFKEMLLKTGTIHVVVVSGYNISLVYSLMAALLGSFYNRTKLLIGFSVALFYALLSGFDPPVIRSWIMGSIAYLGKYYGRSFPTLRVLIVSGLLMILWQPLFSFSLSFQLSFCATLSLILFSDTISKLSITSKIPEFFREDFTATVAAQILVWPLISIYFGRVSIISILVNTLVLWTVPVATVFGGAFLLLFFVGDFLSRILAFFVYIPLGIFANAIELFSKVSFAQVEFQFSLVGFAVYYLIVLFMKVRKSLFASLDVGEIMEKEGSIVADVS